MLRSSLFSKNMGLLLAYEVVFAVDGDKDIS
jgi:hypothetical protein